MAKNQQQARSRRADGNRHVRTVVAAALAGAVLAGAATLLTLYDRPGRSAVHRILVDLGLRPSRGTLYGYSSEDFHRPTADRAWAGVQSPTNPQWLVRRGIDVVRHASGFDLPVNIAFAERLPGEAEDDPDAPFYYVDELQGTIKYVTRDARVFTYASDLTNFGPDFSFDAMKNGDEKGLSGLMIVPGTHDLIVTGTRLDPESGLIVNRVLRLYSENGGRRMSRSEVIFSPEEFSAPAHQIQQVVATPDGHLLVAVGDAMRYRHALDLSTFRGKVLRMNYDGSAAVDNPFYDPSRPDAPISYVFAYGVRNVFDIDFDPATGHAYATDVGDKIDRLLSLEAGASYAWNGDQDSTRVNALFTWGPANNVTPVGLTFLRHPSLGPESRGHLYVGLFGLSDADQRQGAGKAIVEFDVDRRTGLLARAPTPLLQYVGSGRSTVLGLAEGPDGLYFTDFLGEEHVPGAHGTASVWRIHPTELTRDLPSADSEALAALSPRARGEILFDRNCLRCHRIDGSGGVEGPDLSDALAALDRKLNSRAYDATLERLLASPESFLVEQRDRLRAVAEAKGPKRVEIWFRHHLDEPRFDNVYAAMPSFSHLSDEEVDSLAAFVLSQH